MPVLAIRFFCNTYSFSLSLSLARSFFLCHDVKKAAIQPDGHTCYHDFPYVFVWADLLRVYTNTYCEAHCHMLLRRHGGATVPHDVS